MAKLSSLVDKAQKKQREQANEASSRVVDTNLSKLNAVENMQNRGSASAWFTKVEAPKLTPNEYDSEVSRLQQIRQQAAVDLNTDVVNDIDKRLKALREQQGLTTFGDRANDVTTAISAGVFGSAANTLGLGVNMFNDPERYQREINRLQTALDTGKTTDGMVLNEAQRKTVEASIADLQRKKKQAESKDSLHNKIYSFADRATDDSALAHMNAKQGLGGVGSTIVDSAVAFGQSAVAGAIGGVTGTGMLPFMVQAFGGATQDARRNGATLEQQIAYGGAQAAKEYVSEKIFGLAVPQKLAGVSGSLDDATKKLIQRSVRNVVNKLGGGETGERILGGLATWFAGGVTEGVEELIGAWVEDYIINPNLRGYDPDDRTAQEKREDALYNMLVGGVSGLMGVTNLLDYDPNAVSTKSVKPRNYTVARDVKEATVSPAAAPEVQQVQQQAAVVQAQNPEAKVLDAATTMYLNLVENKGKNTLKKATNKADIVSRLIAGKKVEDGEINALNLTDAAYRDVFTQLTGVQFPNGSWSDVQILRNVARSAHTVAQAVKAQVATVAEDARVESQITEEQILERAKEARAKTTPESDKKAARILAQARGEIAPDGTALLNYKDFAARHKQVFPDASPQETARMYDLYLKENQTISFMGRRMTRQQVLATLNSAPGSDKMTPEERAAVEAHLNELFDAELEQQRQDGKDATEHSVRNKEANNGREGQHSVHGGRLSGQPDQRTGEQGGRVPEAARGEEGTAGTRDISDQNRNPGGESGTPRGERSETSGAFRNFRGQTHEVKVGSSENGDTVLEVDNRDYDDEVRAARAKFTRVGMTLRAMVGGYRIGKTGGMASGVAQKGVGAWASVNHKLYSFTQLSDHELVHLAMWDDPEVATQMVKAFLTGIDPEVRDQLMDDYETIYDGIFTGEADPELELMKEIFCDAYAGLPRIAMRDERIVRTGVESLQSIIKPIMDEWIANKEAAYRTAGTVFDGAGNPVVESNDTGYSRFSMSTYDESGRDILTQWMGRAVVNGDLTSQDADDIIKTMDLIYDICKEARESGKYAPFDAWSEAKVVVNEDGSPVFSVVKANGDYAMNLDFSLVCKKRRTLDAVLNELVRRGFVDNLALNEKQIVKINELIRSYGFETACDLCFVDAKRYRQGKVADDFVKLYNDLVLSMVPKNSGLQPQYFNFGSSTLVTDAGTGIHELPDAELDFTKIDKVLATKGEKTVEYKTAMLLKNSPADRKLTMRGDFLSTRGFDAINRENPRVLKLFNSKKGSGGPKSAVSDVQYLNEVLTSKTFTPEKAYAVGGVRIQSFSDYVPRMVFDYVQMIADLSAKKLPAHSYTKEELYVKQFGLTGMKINMSLIPKVVDGGIAPGLDADGNYAWADESFDFEEAKKIQNAEGYSRNCGTIAVGVSDEHIRTLMADPDIRMVIPYHKSGLSPIVAKMNKIDQFVNYTDFQNTRHPNGKHGKKLNKDVAADKKLLDEMPDFNTRMRELGDPRAAAEEYVRWCEEHDLLPKFDQFAYKQIDGVVVEKDGQRVVDENYYKLLEDFTVYDNGEYTPQTGLTMTFPDENSAFGSMKDLIKRGLEEDAVLEGKRTEKVPEIVGEIMKFSVAEDKPFDLSDYTIDDILKWSDEEFDRAYEALGLADTLSDDVLLDDDFSVEDIAEEMEEAPEKIEILYRRAGLGGSHVAEDKQAVMTEERIDARIKEHGATQPDYARRYITRIAPKDFIDMTVYERNVDRQNFDTRVGGDFGTKMGEWDFESALRDSEEPPVLIIDKSTGQIIGHNGRHRIRALEMSGIESVEIEVQLHDEDGYMIKYGAETIPDMAISSQFDTKIETHLSNIIPLNKSHRDEIMQSYGEKAHADAAVKYSITPQFEQWYKETYGEDVSTAHLKRRLQTAERRAAEAEHDKKAAELKNTIDSQMNLTAWMIHHTKKMREQKRASDAKLAEARKAKTEAVRTAVAETKEIERAKAEVQHDADRMAERRNAAKRLRTQENAYVKKITELKENFKLKRNAARATLRDAKLAEKKRNEIEAEQGAVNTIRKDPKTRAEMEKRQSAAEKLRFAGREFYRTFISGANAIERFAKRQISDMRADALINIVGGTGSTIDRVFKDGLYDRAGNRIGDAMREVFLCWDDAHKKVNEGQQALLQDFMLHWHNIDRMSIVARAESALETFELNHEWLRDMDQKEFARLVAMPEKEVEKLGKYEAQQRAFEYVRLIRAYNEAQNKPIFADDKGNSVTAETSQRIVDQYLAEQPWLLDKANGIYEWWDLFMRNWAVGDTISEAEYNRMRQMYPHYVPTYRVDKAGVGGANFVGAGGASVSKAVKKAKGSFSEVMNIEDSFANLVGKIIKLNRVNELYMNIIDTAMLDDGSTFGDLAYFDWESSWQTGEYAKALLDEDLTDTVDKTEKTGFEDLGNNEYKLTGWRDGRKFTAFISKDMYQAVEHVTGYAESERDKRTMKVGRILTNPMKMAITGANPFFALRNFARDVSSAYINGISGVKFPIYLKQAFVEMGGNSDHWQQFQALGGTHAGYYHNEKAFSVTMAEQTNVFKKTLSGLQWINENAESATRFAEYLATLDKLGDTYEARLQGIKNAAEVTVDFSRKGDMGKTINAFVPYWNPAVQGIDRLVRSVIDSPDGSKLWKQATVTLGRAALSTVFWEAVQYALLSALDRDDEWEQLSDRVKDTYYCIPLKNEKKFLKIPKNREWGAILGTPFMRMLEYANGRENPFENYVETALVPNFLPPGITDAVVISQLYDLAKNEDFAGRTIVPSTLEKGSRQYQYDADTSYISRALGMLIKDKISPMQVDYIIEDYLGDWGELATTISSEAFWKGAKSPKDVVEIFTGTMVADARYSNAQANSYYSMLDELDKVVQDKKNQLGIDKYKKTIEYQTQNGLEKMYGNDIAELNRQVREMPDGPEKDELKTQIAQLAAQALEFYEDSMAGRIENPIRTAEYADLSGKVAEELIRMDKFTEDYSFVPYPTVKTKYPDPDDKSKEYVLTDDQKDEYRAIYLELYDEMAGELMKSNKYKKKSDTDKAVALEELRDDVLDATKEKFHEWLEDTRAKSVKKSRIK